MCWLHHGLSQWRGRHGLGNLCRMWLVVHRHEGCAWTRTNRRRSQLRHLGVHDRSVAGDVWRLWLDFIHGLTTLLRFGTAILEPDLNVASAHVQAQRQRVTQLLVWTRILLVYAHQQRRLVRGQATTFLLLVKWRLQIHLFVLLLLLLHNVVLLLLMHVNRRTVQLHEWRLLLRQKLLVYHCRRREHQRIVAAHQVHSRVDRQR